MSPLKFGNPNALQPQRQPPPNYFSRRVQVRLLLLVFLFMAVLMALSEARKPENYQWMWSLGKDPSVSGNGQTIPRPAGSAPEAESPVNPRKAFLPNPVQNPLADDAAGTSRELSEASRNLADVSQADSLDAFDSLPPLLDQQALATVKDDRVLRSEEYEVWFRLWQRLQSTLDTRDFIPAPGLVRYTQLFAQPNEYRGKLISVRGRARMGYYVSAKPNPYDIQGYYVLWLQVNDNLRSPPAGSAAIVAVYCLELPAGFPVIHDRQTAGATELDHPMQFTGVLFKRWVYLSQGGPELAPLILAQVTQWSPPAAAVKPNAGSPSGRLLVGVVLLAALMGVAIAIAVYQKSRWSRQEISPLDAVPESLPDFSQDHVRGGTRESLNDLKQDDPAERE